MRKSVPKINGFRNARHDSSSSTAFLFGSRVVVMSLCLMVCVVPLALPSEIYQPVFSPKFLALHLCIALCCLGWLIQTRWGRKTRLAASPLLLPALCWMAVGLIAAPATTHPLDTAVELVNQATLLILLCVVASAFPLSRLTPVLWANALTGLAVAVVGILQYHNLSPLDLPTKALPSATFINRNFAAEYLICALPLSGLLFLAAKDRLTLAVSGLSASLMAVFLVYTRTRSAWVGAIGALLTVGCMLVLRGDLRRSFYESLRPRMNRPKRTWTAGFAALFLILSLLPPQRPSAIQGQGLPGLPETKTDVASTAMSILQEEKEASRDHSQSERLAMWSTTLRMVVAHPLLGVGPGGWKRAFPGYDRGTTIAPITFPRWPHNDYLSIASEYGLIGLGVYLWLLTSGFRCLLTMARAQDPFARLAAPLFALSILSVLGDACFAFPKDMPHAVMFPYLLFGLAAGAVAGEQEKRPHPPPSPPSPSGRGRGDQAILPLLQGRVRSFPFPLVPFLFLFVSLGAVELSRRHVGFDRHYIRALSWADLQKDWPATLSEVRSALDYGTFQPFVLILEGYALQHLGRDTEAEAAYGQALVYAPHVWQAHHCLSVLRSRQGRLQEALANARTALELCPSATIVRYNLGAIYHQMGEHDRAEQAFRDVLRADPGDAEAHFNIGYLYDIRRRPDSAAVYYQQAIRLEPKMSQAYLFLGNLFFSRENFREARDAYRAFLNLTPDDTANVRLAKERIAQCEERIKQ